MLGNVVFMTHMAGALKLTAAMITCTRSRQSKLQHHREGRVRAPPLAGEILAADGY